MVDERKAHEGANQLAAAVTRSAESSTSLQQQQTATTSETPLFGGVRRNHLAGMSDVTRGSSYPSHEAVSRRRKSNGKNDHVDANVNDDDDAHVAGGSGSPASFTAYQAGRQQRTPAYTASTTNSNVNEFTGSGGGGSSAGGGSGPGSGSNSNPVSMPNSAASSPLLTASVHPHSSHHPSHLQQQHQPIPPPLLSNLSPFAATSNTPGGSSGGGYPFPGQALAPGQASAQLQQEISNLAITPTPGNPNPDSGDSESNVNSTVANMPAMIATRPDRGPSNVSAPPSSSSSASFDQFNMPAWLAAAQQQSQQSGGGPFYTHNPYLSSSSSSSPAPAAPSSSKTAPPAPTSQPPPQQQPSTLGLGFLQSSGQPSSFTASPKSTFATPFQGDSAGRSGGAVSQSRRSSHDDYAMSGPADRRTSNGDAAAAAAAASLQAPSNGAAVAAGSGAPPTTSSGSRTAPLPQYDPSGHRNMSWTPASSSSNAHPQPQHRGSMSNAPPPPPPLDASGTGSGSTADVRSLPATPIMSISRRVSAADSAHTPFGAQGVDDAMQGGSAFWNSSHSSASAMDVDHQRRLSQSPTAKTNRVGRGQDSNNGGTSTPGGGSGGSGGARAGSRSRSSTNSMPALVTHVSSEGDASVKMEQDDNDDKVIDHRKRKRNRTIQSCLPCHQNKRKCDRKRPCSRCTALGLTGQCVYEVDHARNPDDPEQTETEHLRSRIAELEQVVRELRQRGTNKTQTGGSTSGSSTPRDQGISEPAEKKRKLIVDRFARFKLDEAHHGMLARTAIGNAMAAEQGLRLNVDPDSSDTAADDGAPRTTDGRRRTSAEQSVEPYIAHASSIPGEELVGDAQGREAYVGVPGGRSMLRRLAEITADKAPDSADKELMTVPEDVAFTGFFPDMRKTFPFTTIWSHENFIGEIIGLLPTKKQAEQ